MLLRKPLTSLMGALIFTLFKSQAGLAHTANKVWFEFHPQFYRVIVQYTVPDLKEFREAQADFKSKQQAEKLYWHLVRGGDFYLGNPEQINFAEPSLGPDPW